MEVSFVTSSSAGAAEAEDAKSSRVAADVRSMVVVVVGRLPWMGTRLLSLQSPPLPLAVQSDCQTCMGNL